MAVYTDAKSGLGEVYPENATETELSRLEPILGPQDVRDRHLFGLPLVSQIPDPITGRAAIMTDHTIQTIIEGAINQAEAELKIDISPVVRKEKHPFDRQAYESYGFIMLRNRPVHSLQRLAVTPANQQEVYSLPLDWVETAYFVRGQINIIPMTAAYIQGGYVPSGTTGGVFFLSIMGNRSWIPAYWQVEYTSGYPNGLVPRLINEMIGTIAAQEILSMLAATNGQSQSHSLSIDGLSQSVSTPGPQVYKQRFDDLQAKRDKLAKQIKTLYGRKIFSSHV